VIDRSGQSIRRRRALAAGRAGLLVAAFYAVAILIFAVLLLAGAVAVLHGPRVVGVVAFFAAMCWASGIWRIASVAMDAGAPGGLVARREEQPGLWTLIDLAARDAGGFDVAELRLELGVGASVADAGRASTRRPQVTLSLGLGLLATISEAQLRVVLSHELEHVRRGDHAYSRRAARLWEGTARAATVLRDEGRWVDVPVVLYASLIVQLRERSYRAAELAADGLADAGDTGARGAETLFAVHAAAVLYPAYWEWDVADALRAGVRPPISTGFASFIRSRWAADQMANGADSVVSEGSPVAARIAALGGAEPHTPTIAPVSALVLVRDLSSLEAGLLAEMAGPAGADGLRPVTWDQAAELVYHPQIEALASSSPIPLEGRPLSDLPAIAAQLDSVGGMEEEPGQWLTASVALALRAAGWRWHTDPGHPLTLERDGERIDPPLLVESLRGDELSAESWSALCARAGLATVRFQARLPDAGPQPAWPVPGDADGDQRAVVPLAADRGEMRTGGFGLAVLWLVSAPLAAGLVLAALLLPLPPVGRVLLAACGAGLFAIAGLFTRRELGLHADGPALTVTRDALTVHHPGLLSSDLVIPIGSVALIAVDDTDPDYRFRVAPGDRWATPVGDSATIGWLWTPAPRPLPHYGPAAEAANLAIVLHEPVVGPPVRRERLGGPLSGERLHGLFANALDVRAARVALEPTGLLRPLSPATLGTPAVPPPPPSADDKDGVAAQTVASRV